jgi:gamma-D-glutamyl-L-lysine dipeptidyl-peptidase
MMRVAAGSAAIGMAALTLALAVSTSPANAQATPPALSRATPSQATLGPATVDVAVATVWRHASSPRAVDAPALASPVRFRQWLDAMTVSQRRALSGRADTQVLLGQNVRVVAVSGTWARVVVPDQPTPLDSRGYPGWIPKRQLIAGVAPSTGTTVTVVQPTTWLRSPSGARLLEVSFGTGLSAHGRSGADWRVRLPDGRAARVAASSVVTRSLPQTSRSIVASARGFLGLAYLWAGTSGFGFDCSGLMEAVYRMHGVRIPRDSSAQAVAGRAVRRANLRAGDLVLFASGGRVHHVGMYVGHGMMLHAPHTGSQVQVTSISTGPFAKEYAGARRFLSR